MEQSPGPSPRVRVHPLALEGRLVKLESYRPPGGNSTCRLGNERKPGSPRQGGPSGAMFRSAAKRTVTTGPPLLNPVELQQVAGKSTGWGSPTYPHSPNYHALVGKRFEEQASHFARLGEAQVYGSCFEGTGAQFDGLQASTMRPGDLESAEFHDSELANVRFVIARTRRQGAHGVAKVARALRELVASQGLAGLSHDQFGRVGFQLQILNREYETESVFKCFSKGSPPLLDVETLIQALQFEIPHQRLRAVHEAWRSINPSFPESISVQELVSRLDPLQHPEVRKGRKTVKAMRRELLESFGASRHNIFPLSEFTLEEYDSRRRKAPVGHLGQPILNPAGRPSGLANGVRRELCDVRTELSNHPYSEDRGMMVPLKDFEAYYAAVSATVDDDDEFEAELVGVWQVGAGNIAADAASLRVHVEFEDGSSKVVLLRNDHGLQGLAGAGVGTGQLWAWGPEAADEVKRRLVEQGVEGIRRVNWRGRFC